MTIRLCQTQKSTSQFVMQTNFYKMVIMLTELHQNKIEGYSSADSVHAKNFYMTEISHNKKVLLREHKRHTARRVASARYAVLSNGGGGTPSSHGGGGYPIQSWWGGTPSSPDWWWEGGYPIQSWLGVLHLVLTWGTLGTTPSRPGMGYPLSRPGMG